MPATLLFLVIGLLAGVLSGVFGIGGGVVIVPALIFIGRLSPITATGTSLAALLLPVGALGAMEYYRRGHLNLPAALWIALGLFLGAWFGAKLANQLAPIYLRRAFAVFLVLIAGRMWFV
ncbi:MAG: TSUP family transporter [Gemmatimonas sp.]